MSDMNTHYRLTRKTPHRPGKFKTTWGLPTESQYDAQAREFLERGMLMLVAELPDLPADRPPKGIRYQVTLVHLNAPTQALTFDFTNSAVERYGPDMRYSDKVEEFQKWGVIPPSPYSILAALASDSQGPTEADEVYMEFGPMLPSKCEEIATFTRRIHRFFTGPELEELLTIS